MTRYDHGGGSDTSNFIWIESQFLMFSVLLHVLTPYVSAGSVLLGRVLSEGPYLKPYLPRQGKSPVRRGGRDAERATRKSAARLLSRGAGGALCLLAV